MIYEIASLTIILNDFLFIAESKTAQVCSWKVFWQPYFTCLFQQLLFDYSNSIVKSVRPKSDGLEIGASAGKPPPLVTLRQDALSYFHAHRQS